LAMAVAAASVAQASDVFQFMKPQLDENMPSDKPYGEPIHSSIKKNGFGMTVEEDIYANNYAETTLKAPLLPFHADVAQHVSIIE